MAAAAPNRWTICLVGIALQVCLGTTYAWSYFQKPLASAFGWSNGLTAWAFCLAICCLGLAAAWGGTRLARTGPRRLAMAGGALFGLGHLIAALALAVQSPALLFLGYGVVGGCGLGLCYVTPVATVAKWFPDRKGLATGLVVMGFGLGALVMSKLLAPLLYQHFTAGAALTISVIDGREVLDHPEVLQGVLARLFAVLGAAFLILTVPLGWLLRDPPAGYVPAGWTPPIATTATGDDPGADIGSCLRSRRFVLLWLVFCCNITAGIAIIGFQSPLYQDLWRKADPGLAAATLAAYGATLIGVTSLFNGLGRSVWGAISDRLGRPRTFTLMLGSQALVFLGLAATGDPWLFAAGLCWILLCYGGGFGAMPGFVLDIFGARRMPAVYGAILTAWSVGGIVGPQLAALFRDRWPENAGTITCLTGAGLVAAGCLLSLLLSDRPYSGRQAKLP